MTDWVIFDADNSPLTFTSNSDLIRIDANDNIDYNFDDFNIFFSAELLDVT